MHYLETEVHVGSGIPLVERWEGGGGTDCHTATLEFFIVRVNNLSPQKSGQMCNFMLKGMVMVYKLPPL